MIKIAAGYPSLILILLALSQPMVNASEILEVKRLTWAGIQLQHGDTTVLVDAVGTDLWQGKAPGGLVPVSVETPRRYALVTHMHNDHFDQSTLHEVLGDRGYVISESTMATAIASRGFRVIPVPLYKPIERGGFVFTAIPAVDGFGDHQVSWIISVANQRFLHAGDTLWHGQWRLIGQQYGPFDAVFLPINGALVGGSEIPAVMTSRHAVQTAPDLRARTMVPIHYGLDDPPHYIEPDNLLKSLNQTATRRGVHITLLQPGQFLTPQ